MTADRPSPACSVTRKKRRGRALFALTWANLIVVLLLYPATHLVAERHWFTTLITYAPQQPFVVPGMVLLIWSLLVRNRRQALLNLTACLFCAFMLMGFNIPLTWNTHAPAIRVMTLNIHHGSHGVHNIADMIRRENSDVVCMQEANVYGDLPDPVPQLRVLLRGWHFSQAGQTVTLSRYPFIKERVYRPEGELGRGFLMTQVDWNGRPLTIYNLHFSTAAKGRSLANSRGRVREYLRETAAVRAEQVLHFTRIAQEQSGPAIAAGDMNTPPRGLVYRRVTRDFQDCFDCGGWGFGNTYRSDVPVLRIDYVFAGRGFRVNRCRVIDAKVSDHRPVIANLTPVDDK